MTDSGVYKIELSAPATVNKVASQLQQIDQLKGNSFFVENLIIGIPDRDAIASGDAIGFQITLISNAEASSLLDVKSPYEVCTEYFKETFTQDDRGLDKDPTVEIELKNFRNVQLPKKFYWNHLITGQDGAIPVYVKMKGNFMSKELPADYHNRTL